MGAADVTARLSAAGVSLTRDGDYLVASPSSALTDELRGLLRTHKAEFLAELENGREDPVEPDRVYTQADQPARHDAPERAQPAEAVSEAIPGGAERRARALAYLSAHSEAVRACFADLAADPANVVLTVAVREPWSAVEVLVSRARFDALALMELAERYPATSLYVPAN